jgi:D-3-phosphoglycerate dehydrogenase
MGNNRPVPSLEALLAEADFVTLHVPETPQTQWHDRRPDRRR